MNTDAPKSIYEISPGNTQYVNSIDTITKLRCKLYPVCLKNCTDDTIFISDFLSGVFLFGVEAAVIIFIKESFANGMFVDEKE